MHQDTIVVVSGTYEEQVKVYPAAGDTNQFYISFMPDDLMAEPPQIRWSYTDTGYILCREWAGAFEIHNDRLDPSGRRCHDMRVTLKAFEVIGEDDAAALGVFNAADDPAQSYATGLFIEDNYFESEHHCDGTVVIGNKGRYADEAFGQSPKWGHFLNNEVVGNIDAVTTYHFAVTARNNRLQAGSEGWHLGAGRIDTTAPSSVPDSLESLFEHNLFYCSGMLGLHFVHGSKGIVRNNIFSRNQEEGALVSHALYLGEPPTPSDPMCAVDSTECFAPAVNGTVVPTEVVAHNNVIDITDGNGLRVHELCIATLYANTITRSGTQTAEQPAFEVVGPNPGTQPLLSTDYELLWANDLDYADSILVGANDINDDTPGGSNPRYQGVIPDGSGVAKYSYMLKTISNPVCGYAAAANDSKAIDQGPPGTAYADSSSPPGVGLTTCDIGAYGGKHNIWDPTGVDLCLEYVEAVGNCNLGQ